MGPFSRNDLRLQCLAITSLFVCTVTFVVVTWHWPLAGDAALMHYVAFLSQHGYSPYVDIQDVNLPGAYLSDWLFQRVFGPSALAWRLFDLFLLGLTGLAMWMLAKPYSRFAALWAASIFALNHGRDGMEQVGQRDLIATPIALFVAVLLSKSRREGRSRLCFWSGVCASAAILIKPALLGFAVLPLAIPTRNQMWTSAAKQSSLRWFYSGAVVPVALCAAWLMRRHSTTSFLYTLTTLIPCHASMGHVAM